nr:MAG TPA: hypothetical protein [Microviridae sp.]
MKQTLGNIGAKRDGTKRLIVAGGGSLPGRSKDQYTQRIYEERFPKSRKQPGCLLQPQSGKEWSEEVKTGRPCT